MADLADISAALAQLAADTLYPNGAAQPSITGAPIRVFEGWPNPDQLDLDLTGRKLAVDGKTIEARADGPVANVSVFPMSSQTANVFQVLDKPYVIVPAVHGISAAAIAPPTITFSGAAGAGEFVTVIADGRKIYSRNGANLAAILAALAADAAADYPGADSTATTLTIPGAQEFIVRIGAPATMGLVTHRQKQAMMVTIWAPNPATRSAIARAIDEAFKAELRIALPDTSQALVRYDRVQQSDNWETVAVFRRDLIYTVEYATLERFTAYEVTSFTTDLNKIVDVPEDPINPDTARMIVTITPPTQAP